MQSILLSYHHYLYLKQYPYHRKQCNKFYHHSMILHLSFSIQNQAYQKPYILHNIL
nr:MAG TPA: hypothetical protein [Caudoviricetes sp.]